jgi:hypothetical protein
MMWQPWRERLTYCAMSAFVTWHTVAMVMAPAPESTALSQALRVWYQPYLTLFRLDSLWEFFAPNVGRSLQLRYNIEVAAGESRSFVATEGLSWFHPSYFWIHSWSDAVTTNFDLYGASAAASLCRKHAALHPIAITLLAYGETNFTPRDYLNGRRPTDPEFFDVKPLQRFKCASP